MLDLFEKYAHWKIITTFLEYPTTSFYGRELAKRLKMSTFTVSMALHELERNGFLVKETKANSIFFRLNDIPLVFALKKFYILVKLQQLKIVDKFIKVDEDMTTLALYGSCASGEYDEKSDLDLICLTEKKESMFNALVAEIENELNRETTLKAVSQTEWRRITEKNSNFYLTVTRNHVLLYGSSLVIR